MSLFSQIAIVVLLFVIASVLINIDSNLVNIGRFLEASYWRERGEREQKRDEGDE